MRYRVLALDPQPPDCLCLSCAKIRDLVQAGARWLDKACEYPSLSERSGRVPGIADQLWDRPQATRLRKGKATPVRRLEEVLMAMQIAPDFAFTRPQSDTNLLFVHRKLATATSTS